METKTLLEKLEFLDDTALTCSVYCLKDGQTYKLDVKDSALQKIARSFSLSIKDKFYEDIRLKNIDKFNDEDAKAIYYFTVDNIIDDISNLFLFDDLEQFDDDLSKLEAIIVKLNTNEENYCLLYKKLAPIHLLQKDKLSMFSFSAGVLQEVKQDILKLDNNFHFLSVEDEIFVFNFNILEKHFKYEDMILQKANSNIELLETIEFLEDLGKLKELSKNKTFAKKLHNIHNSPAISIIKDNPSKVESFINNHNELKDFFDIKSGKLYLKKQTKKNAEKLIKLLNDDFIQSELTEIMYETMNKEIMR
jgi:hypothetical protein